MIIIIPKDKVCQWAAIENVISTPNKPVPEFDKTQTIIQETQEKTQPEELKPIENSYSGISSSAAPESILPETEEIINNTDLDIDDIKKGDLAEL